MASGILQNGVHTNTPRVWLPFWSLGWIHKLLRPHNATASKYKENNLSLCLSNSHDYTWEDQQVRLLSHAPPSGQTLSWWRLPGHWQFSDETLGGWATVLLPSSPPAAGTLLCGRTAGETQTYRESTAVLTVNPLNAELNPICYLLALLGAHHFLHVSRIGVKRDKDSFAGRCGHGGGQVSVTSELRLSSQVTRVCGWDTSCSPTQ